MKANSAFSGETRGEADVEAVVSVRVPSVRVASVKAPERAVPAIAVPVITVPVITVPVVVTPPPLRERLAPLASSSPPGLPGVPRETRGPIRLPTIIVHLLRQREVFPLSRGENPSRTGGRASPPLTRHVEALATGGEKQRAGLLKNLNAKEGAGEGVNHARVHLPGNVAHLLKDSKRLHCLDRMKATLENPLEVWESQRVDPRDTSRAVQKNYAFLALFDNGGKRLGYIVIVRADGELCTHYDIGVQQIDKARRGKLVYEKQ